MPMLRKNIWGSHFENVITMTMKDIQVNVYVEGRGITIHYHVKKKSSLYSLYSPCALLLLESFTYIMKNVWCPFYPTICIFVKYLNVSGQSVRYTHLQNWLGYYSKSTIECFIKIWKIQSSVNYRKFLNKPGTP